MNRPTQLRLGDDLTWKIALKEAIDAGPSISLRKNNVPHPMELTIVQEDSVTFVIEAEIDDIEEGDQLTFVEQVVIDSTTYRNSWVCFVSLPERGTDELEPGEGIEFLVTVQNDNLDVIGNATVNLFTEEAVKIKSLVTDESTGEATFNVAPGTYLISVSGFHGYKPFDPIEIEIDEHNDSTVLVLESDDTTGKLDLSGIRRVKTKNMEIETYDPELMQRVKHKEHGSLPSFCDSHFCIGVRKNECN